MKQLYVEANKSFKLGFVLTEPEIRRFNDLIREQVKKINAEPVISYTYNLKFQNGIVAETDNIDSVLEQENESSKKIISLEIIGKDQLENTISIDFHNLDSDNIQSDNSIKYNIRSTDRDWVFVTSSQIEERINKIKRGNFSIGKNKLLGRLIFPFGGLLALLVMMFSLINSISNRDSYLPDIKLKYDSGEIKNTDELILAIEHAKNQQLQHLDLVDVFYFPGIILGGLIIILICFYIYTWRLYPLYNFCWGEYLDVFKKKETSRKTFNTVVIIGLIVSVVGGIIANFLNVKI
jgi:hypothetical protein